MKRFLALLLAAMMVFSLCACGNGDDGDKDVADDGAATLDFGRQLTFADEDQQTTDGTVERNERYDLSNADRRSENQTFRQ